MITTAITAIAEAIGKIFSYSETAKEHQSETEVTKKLHDSAKAVDIAEQIIFLVDRRNEIDDYTFDKIYQKLRKKFFRYN